MTIYNISIITSTGFPYYHKKLKNLPEGIKLYQRFFDFTESLYREHDTVDPISSFELNAGLISALFEFAKNIDKKILKLEFKSLQKDSSGQFHERTKYKGDALITVQSETYLLHRSIKQKIKFIYNTILFPKIPLETANIINEEEEKRIVDILTDVKARSRVINYEKELKNLSNKYLESMSKYGLYNIVIASFDLSPIVMFGNKLSYEDLEIILRNLGEIPDMESPEWKFLQSFHKENQVWVYLANSGIGVTAEGLFEPYFYLLFGESPSYLGDLLEKLALDFNKILG
jgi:hypothetical protein